MFQGTIGVEIETDEESVSRPRKSLKSILDRVSERMEESTGTTESDALDVPQSDLAAALDKDGGNTRAEKRSALDMLFGGVQREVDLSRAHKVHNH
jgi:hypothetical protein